MHLARRIRSVFPPLPHARSFSVSHRHHAQTAFKPITEDEDNGSNSHAHHHRAEVHSHPRKGKQRADPFQEQYRFPQMGRNGGSPDPFEVLGVERSASEKEVKQQCEYHRSFKEQF